MALVPPGPATGPDRLMSDWSRAAGRHGEREPGAAAGLAVQFEPPAHQRRPLTDADQPRMDLSPAVGAAEAAPVVGNGDTPPLWHACRVYLYLAGSGMFMDIL